jgi:hypothetical protein
MLSSWYVRVAGAPLANSFSSPRLALSLFRRHYLELIDDMIPSRDLCRLDFDGFLFAVVTDRRLQRDHSAARDELDIVSIRCAPTGPTQDSTFSHAWISNFATAVRRDPASTYARSLAFDAIQHAFGCNILLQIRELRCLRLLHAGLLRQSAHHRDEPRNFVLCE